MANQKSRPVQLGELAGLLIAWGAIVFCLGLVLALNLWAWAKVGELW